MSPSSPPLADRIDALLPQTQCTQCGYPGCRPYAEAIAEGEADINRCPPGDDAGIRALAALLERPAIPLDTHRGQPGPLTVAVIDERHCIGCTLCIQACPVDAIVGANKRMHTVLPDWCTGCDLCVAPCPVDCIAMIPVAPARPWTRQDADAARRRHRARAERLERERRQREARLAARAADDAAPARAGASAPSADERKRAAIENALARARERRQRAPS